MRSSKEFPLRQSGIYRNLPTIDPSVTGLTALVAGATGISGFNTIRCLLESASRWHKVYALSRNPPSENLLRLLEPSQRERLCHVPVDLLGSAEDVAESLKSAKVVASHVFFYAYIQPKASPDVGIWSNGDELVRVNSQLFSNFLSALPLANIHPRRIMLQTGGKNYGIQYGLARQPSVESDPQPKHLGPNFYYPQEHALFSYCNANPDTKWNVIRPFAVFGAAESAQMNSLFVLGAYAAVQCQKGEPLLFPGGWEIWQAPYPVSTARLTGYLTEWAVLQEECENQAFNAEDGNVINWDRIFHELSRWYGLKHGVVGPSDEPDITKIEIKGGKESPLGYGPNLYVGQTFDFLEWARQPSNVEIWEDIRKNSQNEIRLNPFKQNVDDTMGLGEYLFTIATTVSMNKARLLGWTGFVDTLEGAFEALSDMAKLGLLPALEAEKARPLM